MSPVWGRLAALAIVCLALVAGPASSFRINLDYGFKSSSVIAAEYESDHLGTWTDPIPGTKALSLPAQILDLGRRDCMANGSNYCFGDTVNYCPGCGNCCVDGNYCCGRGKQCCGSGCCESDQTCSRGKCLSSVTTFTVTSTVFKTVTHVATQRATVLIAEVERSTAISTVDVTVSSAATQTNVVWVTATATATATAAAKKAGTIPTSARWIKAGRLRQWTVLGKRASQTLDGTARIPRQANQKVPPTVTVYATQTADVTSISSIIVTARTTSTIITTVIQTNTRVLHAETTIDVTSTLTITSHPPSVQTVTTTADLILPTTAPPTSEPSEPPPPLQQSQSISTPAVAGIAAGGSIFLLILTALMLLCIRRRRHWQQQAQLRRSETPPALDYGHDSNAITGIPLNARKPTLPPLPAHFAPSYPEHHAAEFQLPASMALGRGGGGVGQDRLGYQHHQNHHHHHERDDSGYTTLVGTPSPTFAGGFLAGGGVDGSGDPRGVASSSSSPGSGAVSPRRPGLTRSVAELEGGRAPVEVSGESVQRGQGAVEVSGESARRR